MCSIGIDIGGANIACGIVAKESALVHKLSAPYSGPQAPLASADVCVELVRTLLENAGLSMEDIDAVGLAVPGQIDCATGGVIRACNLGYHDFLLTELMRAQLRETLIHAENDANAAPRWPNTASARSEAMPRACS